MSITVNTSFKILLMAAIVVVFIPASVDATGNVFDYFNQGISQENIDETVANDPLTVDNERPSTNNTWLFISALLKLVAATTVIILIIYFGAKIITEKRNRIQSNQNIQTISVHAVGQNKTLQLVRIGKRAYILGVAENISLIKECTLEESIELYQQIDSESQESSETKDSLANQFDSIFKNKLSEFKKRSAPQQNHYENEREYL